ncbi:MAG: hypothetical protein PHU21_12400, partial [Elusimicrobia bacterium]|nr:hypothetical protein [Elusimicrobiota bacterium]
MLVCAFAVFAQLLLGQCYGAAPAAVVPPLFQAVLERHALDAEKLKALGYVIWDGRCFTLDGNGELAAPTLTADELEAALAARQAAALGPQRPLALPKLELNANLPPASLNRFFDGAPPVPAAGMVPDPVDPQTFAAQKPPMQEPEFDESWDRVAADLRDPKRRARGLAALSKRFIKDETSETGLSPDAPEALRMLTLAIHEGRGGTPAAVLLRQQLAAAANLKPEQKAALARNLRSALTVYVALGRSQAAHALDAQLYFRRMVSLLSSEGRGLAEFIREKDPDGRYASLFLLRSHAYDSLIPYLNQHPEEAGAIVPLLFPDDRAQELQ